MELDSALPAPERAHLASSLDLPQFGGVGLQSLMRAADAELLGLWASITFDLVTFCQSKGMSVYSRIANALDSMADPPSLDEHQAPSPHPANDVVMTVSTTAHAFLEIFPKE